MFRIAGIDDTVRRAFGDKPFQDYQAMIADRSVCEEYEERDRKRLRLETPYESVHKLHTVVEKAESVKETSENNENTDAQVGDWD